MRAVGVWVCYGTASRARERPYRERKIRKSGNMTGLGLSHLLGKFVGAARERPYRERKKSEIRKFDWGILSHLLGKFAGVA